jgi:hypothetical protein
VGSHSPGSELDAIMTLPEISELINLDGISQWLETWSGKKDGSSKRSHEGPWCALQVVEKDASWRRCHRAAYASRKSTDS